MNANSRRRPSETRRAVSQGPRPATRLLSSPRPRLLSLWREVLKDREDLVIVLQSTVREPEGLKLFVQFSRKPRVLHLELPDGLFDSRTGLLGIRLAIGCLL
jgi:hypothetical protein